VCPKAELFVFTGFVERLGIWACFIFDQPSYTTGMGSKRFKIIFW
jgi:hypothetical protein